MLRSRMFWNLFLGYGSLIIFAVALLGITVDAQAEKNEMQSLEERLLNEAFLIREMLGDGGDRAKWAAGWFTLPTRIPTRVTLVANDGHVFADSARAPSQLDNHADRVEVLEAFRTGSGKSIRRSHSVQQELMYVALRADGKGASAEPYVIRISMPTDAVRQRLWGLRQLIVTATLLTTALALGLAFWLTRRTVQPVRDLIAGAEEIAAGDYGQRVSAAGSTEIAQLARTFNHMSERLAAQFAQIDEDRQQLRTMLSSMVEGVVAIDSEQTILFANDRAGELLDFVPRSAVSRKLNDMVRERPLQEAIERALDVENNPVQSVALSLPGNTLLARSFRVQVARLPGAPSRGAVLVLHDDTELRRLERLRQEFVANVSHELKTPLAIIKACIETLIAGGVDDPAFRGQFLDRIADQTERLHALIIDLLRLARIESATEAFTMEDHDLATLVAQCLDRRRALAESRNHTLRSIAAPAEQGEARIRADEEAVEQILDNLVDNALKYTPEGGAVEVAWRREGNEIVLDVRDTGIGIPKAELPRIFERFYRVDKARSRELGGTGLGLSIVKHLVQAMQGTVQAESVVGQGSTFTIRFPASRTGEA